MAQEVASAYALARIARDTRAWFQNARSARTRSVAQQGAHDVEG